MVSEMADAFDGGSDFDRLSEVVGGSPLGAFLRTGAPLRRTGRAFRELRGALIHSRKEAERLAEEWRSAASDSEDVQDALDAASFFRSLLAEITELVDIANPGRYDKFQIEFGLLLSASALDELSEALQNRAMRMSSPVASVHDVAELLGRAPADISTWRDMYYPAALDLLTDIQAHGYTVTPGSLINHYLSERQVRRIALSVRTAESAAEQAQTATGNAGQDVIGSTFKTAAEDEAAQAKRWTWAVFALVVSGAAGTLTFVTVENDLLTSVSAGWALIFKALIGLPFYGLAAYCAHVAGEHRSLARHFRILSVQLRSVGAYVAPMSDEQRSELRMILGRQAFSAPVPADVPSPGISPGADDLTALLGRALDIAKSDKSN
ncbi:hypothetical protein [Nocardia sp. 348MFTsu5.1]|uniref:hypothetical protein n=1 Tax=Nocardia sp. 348MFTsu5.1 TaxID=1172185 RepID=UPI000369F04B|nr:hypothetical protein [Nocardia sp. 348MFTsu5.1]